MGVSVSLSTEEEGEGACVILTWHDPDDDHESRRFRVRPVHCTP